MEEKLLTNERSLSQIALRFAAGSMPLLFLLFNLFLIITGDFFPVDLDAIGGIAIAAFVIGLLSIPFGIVGGRIGKNWRKTQRATINGVILGTILGTILIASCVSILLISVLPQ